MVLTHKHLAAMRPIAALLWLCLAAFNSVANSPPVGNPDGYVVNEDTTLTVAAPGVLSNDSDPDGDSITAVSWTTPVHGSLITFGSSGLFTYRPLTNYNGADLFTYRVRDSFGNTSAPVTVTITINPVNDTPLATNDSYNAAPGVALTVNAPGVLTNDFDVDGDTLTAVLATNVTHGT